MPPDQDQERWNQVGGVADELKRELGEKRPDAAGEVGRRRRTRSGAEEPDRVAWYVGGKRNDPDEGGRKQEDAQELTGPA